MESFGAKFNIILELASSGSTSSCISKQSQEKKCCKLQKNAAANHWSGKPLKNVSTSEIAQNPTKSNSNILPIKSCRNSRTTCQINIDSRYSQRTTIASSTAQHVIKAYISHNMGITSRIGKKHDILKPFCARNGVRKSRKVTTSVIIVFQIYPHENAVKLPLGGFTPVSDTAKYLGSVSPRKSPKLAVSFRRCTSLRPLVQFKNRHMQKGFLRSQS